MGAETRPVGFFDSGLGGISVLRQTVRLLPGEDFLYFGDNLHAPYGTKAAEEVLELSRAALCRLQAEGVKALVIACNTATSAAVAALRKENPDFPIIGTEPAVKPAVESYPGGRILMLATPMTVREEKFRLLCASLSGFAEIIPVGCEGLMEFVERGELEGAALDAYLKQKLAPYLDKPADAVVLGCTHYPFLRRAIQKAVGNAEIIDGSAGIARRLRQVLEERALLNPQAQGRVDFRFSGSDPQTLALAQRLLNAAE